MLKYDAIIIGSGQAGTPLAFKLASRDKKVAFIEKENLGGTCVNVGCTPTKTYVASARRMWDIHSARDLGIKVSGEVKADMTSIKNRKDKIVTESVDGITKGVDKNENITLYRGQAHFRSDKVVVVNEDVLTAEDIFINVGARPSIPDGYSKVPFLTSSSILEIEEVPQHLIIVGGSYIGLEFGQMFRRFGSEVTIVEKDDRIIGREDKETSRAIQQFLEDEGIDFRCQAECLGASLEKSHSISVQIDCSKEGRMDIKGSHLLLAVGRQPNTDILNLSNTNIKVSEEGFIEVDDYLQTSVKGIYALGDCNGRGAFTHTAYNDYEIIAENMFDNKDRKVSDRILTYGLYVDPPLGRVGLTRQQAIDQDFQIVVGHLPMKEISRAKEKGETNGFMEVVVEDGTNKILGATVLGVGGDEIISSFVHMMYSGQSFEIFRDTVQPHPTVSELIPTMLESLSKPE